MKAKTQAMIDSFKGQPMADLFRTIDAIEAQQAEVNRKLSCARRALKQKVKQARERPDPA